VLVDGGGATLQIADDATDQETLAWHAFPAGIGYQFDRKVPGAIDISGPSIRNYFDLFTKNMSKWPRLRLPLPIFLKSEEAAPLPLSPGLPTWVRLPEGAPPAPPAIPLLRRSRIATETLNNR